MLLGASRSEALSLSGVSNRGETMKQDGKRLTERKLGTLAMMDIIVTSLSILFTDQFEPS